MDDDVRRQAQAILSKIPHAWRVLKGSAPAAKRASAVRSMFSAYTKRGPLAPHVRDGAKARGVRAAKASLRTLGSLAQSFAEAGEDPMGNEKGKLRMDANEIAHRVMLEATGQAPRTSPPGERDEDEKHPEAVERGQKGGEKGGDARAASLTDEERTRAAIKAAYARWRKKDD